MSTVHNQVAEGKVKVGNAAPNFTLPTQSGSTASLNDFLGKKSFSWFAVCVLYFVPCQYPVLIRRDNGRWRLR